MKEATETRYRLPFMSKDFEINSVKHTCTNTSVSTKTRGRAGMNPFLSVLYAEGSDLVYSTSP